MKNLLKLLAIITMVACSPTKSVVESEPYMYSVQNEDGSVTKVKSHTKGTLSETEYEHLKNHLSSISEQNIDFSKKAVINFIDNDPLIYRKGFEVPWDIFKGNMDASLDKIEECNHFWIINKRVKDLHYYHGKKIHWLKDENEIIRNLFFMHNGLNGGFVIVKPNGEYFLKVGEYKKSDLLKSFKAF